MGCQLSVKSAWPLHRDETHRRENSEDLIVTQWLKASSKKSSFVRATQPQTQTRNHKHTTSIHKPQTQPHHTTTKTHLQPTARNHNHTNRGPTKKRVRRRLPQKSSSLQKERFVRDVFHKSHVKSPKQVFRARFPPKHTREVCKTSSNSHRSSLQNERFAPATKSDDMTGSVMFMFWSSAKCAPRQTCGMISTRLNTLTSTKVARQNCHENTSLKQHPKSKSQCHSHTQHLKHTTLLTPIPI